MRCAAGCKLSIVMYGHCLQGGLKPFSFHPSRRLRRPVPPSHSRQGSTPCALSSNPGRVLRLLRRSSTASALENNHQQIINIMDINTIKSRALAAVLCLWAAVSAQAQIISAGALFKADGIVYQVLSETGPTCKVANYSDNPVSYQGDIVIPASVTHNGYEYTVIGAGGFRDCQNLHSVKLPSTVTSIDESAFEYCSNLVSVEFSSVTAIPNVAFDGCTNLTNVSMPESLTSIGKYAFEDCKSLTGLAVPNGVKELGEGAFYGCTLLADVTLGSSITTIGDYAFRDCKSLTGITIPNSVVSMGRGCFQNV